MDKQLSFVLKLSLEEMALRRVVVNLWNEADILASIAELKFCETREDEVGLGFNEKWRAIVENGVKTKMAKLVIPESLKKRMSLIVRPIGLQIRDWKIFMSDYLSDSRKNVDLSFLEQLCWTSCGAIDYQKTVEKIVRLEKFDVVTRYKLACSHCMSDSIPILWEELPENYKKSYRDEINVMRYVDPPLEFYWNYALKGRLSRIKETFEKFYPRRNVTLHQGALHSSACSGNKTATEYFFQKLSYQEREDCLITTAYDVAVKQCNPQSSFKPFKFRQRNLSDVLCYLLTVMSPEQQMQVFKFHFVEVLPCFLEWPWQDLFLEASDLAWAITSENKYSHLAHYIHRNLINAGYYFPNTIQKFFLGSPNFFRRLFIWEFHSWFPQLSFAEDSETIKVIFRNVDIENKALLVSSNWFLKLFEGLGKAGKWRLVEQCLREALLPWEHRMRLWEYMDWFVKENFRAEELIYMNSRLTQCFPFLNETEESAIHFRSLETKH